MHATRVGLLDIVTMLVEHFHVDIELPTINKETAVFYAARSGDEDLLDYFMSKVLRLLPKSNGMYLTLTTESPA